MSANTNIVVFNPVANSGGNSFRFDSGSSTGFDTTAKDASTSGDISLNSDSDSGKSLLSANHTNARWLTAVATVGMFLVMSADYLSDRATRSTGIASPPSEYVADNTQSNPATSGNSNRVNAPHASEPTSQLRVPKTAKTSPLYYPDDIEREVRATLSAYGQAIGLAQKLERWRNSNRRIAAIRDAEDKQMAVQINDLVSDEIAANAEIEDAKGRLQFWLSSLNQIRLADRRSFDYVIASLDRTYRSENNDYGVMLLTEIKPHLADFDVEVFSVWFDDYVYNRGM